MALLYSLPPLLSPQLGITTHASVLFLPFSPPSTIRNHHGPSSLALRLPSSPTSLLHILSLFFHISPAISLQQGTTAAAPLLSPPFSPLPKVKIHNSYYPYHLPSLLLYSLFSPLSPQLGTTIATPLSPLAPLLPLLFSQSSLLSTGRHFYHQPSSLPSLLPLLIPLLSSLSIPFYDIKVRQDPPLPLAPALSSVVPPFVFAPLLSLLCSLYSPFPPLHSLQLKTHISISLLLLPFLFRSSFFLPTIFKRKCLSLVNVREKMPLEINLMLGTSKV